MLRAALRQPVRHGQGKLPIGLTETTGRVNTSTTLFRPRQLRQDRSISGDSRKSSWVGALSSLGTSIVPPPPPHPTSGIQDAGRKTSDPKDPASIIKQEMKTLSKNMQNLLGSGHPILDKVAKYYVQGDGKHMRPMIVLLMARATAIAPKDDDWTKFRLGPNPASGLMSKDVNASLSPLSILRDFNPGLFNLSRDSLLEMDHPDVLSTQKRLAEIVELIHTASLLHDDVIDSADSRRGRLSGNLAFGNKMAVLAGDFLFGRASVSLARLRDPEVVELLSTVIANLVEGEFMQLKNTSTDYASPEFAQQTMEYYLQKSYLKTASLISKSCRGSALLGGATREVADAAYDYGKNLGLAFQLVDDLLDFTVTEVELGKPAGADLKLGLATAPVIFALEKYPDLGPMIERQFDQPGDVEKAREYVSNSDALAKTRQLAEQFSQDAIDAISIFPESESRTGLEQLARKALKRRK